MCVIHAVHSVELIADYIWLSVNSNVQSPAQDHRKSLLIFWFVANIRRCVPDLPISPPPEIISMGTSTARILSYLI